jgi:FliI/YscN family ATPase
MEAGPQLLGRVIDGFGRPLDNLGPLSGGTPYELYAAPPGPLEREPIDEPLSTGIRAIDSLLTCGKGQRIGIFGGSGVGKSTLLGAMARSSDADVSVIALIGERNREVRDFIEHELGPEGLKKAVLVVATSDRPAPLRIRAAFVALAIAEYFRDQAKDVLLVMDSVTRLAMAQREIGLAAGEPPSQKGYTPSVFNLLPKIFERAGKFRRGSITGFFTVLVEGDDFNEPICDAVRAILDGHIVLSRELGAAGHYPAIDVLQSVSRLAPRLCTPEQKEAAAKVREAMATHQRSEDLINLGAYASGANPKLDAAIRVRPLLLDFLKQDSREQSPFEKTMAGLSELAKRADAK